MDDATGRQGRSSRKWLIAIIATLIVAIGGAALAYELLDVSATNARDEGSLSAADDFRMTSADGTDVTLDELKGKPIVLNFWSSNCGPCKREMPEFQSYYERYGDRIEFVMVDVIGFNGETRAQAMRFIEQSGYDFPVYFDTFGDASRAYDLNSVPRSFFITARGNVAMIVQGSADKETIAQGIDLILE